MHHVHALKWHELHTLAHESGWTIPVLNALLRDDHEANAMTSTFQVKPVKASKRIWKRHVSDKYPNVAKVAARLALSTQHLPPCGAAVPLLYHVPHCMVPSL